MKAYNEASAKEEDQIEDKEYQSSSDSSSSSDSESFQLPPQKVVRNGRHQMRKVIRLPGGSNLASPRSSKSSHSQDSFSDKSNH